VSIVARVFVVFNFILSIVFLIMSMNIWTAKTKWQKMYEKEKSKNVEMLVAAQGRQVDLSKSLAVSEQQYYISEGQARDLLVRLNKAQGELLQARANIVKKENGADLERSKLEESQRRENLLRDRMAELQQVVLKQHQAITVARQNEVNALNQRTEMENELNQTKTQLAAILRDKRQMESDLAYMNARIEGLYLRGYDVAEILNEDPQASQPNLPGAVVVAVQPDLNLVVISKDAKHGVKPGFYFTVRRGGKFIALCQVEKVLDDMCSARILPKRSPPDTEVRVNDEALSRP